MIQQQSSLQQCQNISYHPGISHAKRCCYETTMHATVDHFAADQWYLTLRQAACSHRNMGKHCRTRRRKNTQDTRKPSGMTWRHSRAWPRQIVSTEPLAKFPLFSQWQPKRPLHIASLHQNDLMQAHEFTSGLASLCSFSGWRC